MPGEGCQQGSNQAAVWELGVIPFSLTQAILGSCCCCCAQGSLLGLEFARRLELQPHLTSRVGTWCFPAGLDLGKAPHTPSPNQASFLPVVGKDIPTELFGDHNHNRGQVHCPGQHVLGRPLEIIVAGPAGPRFPSTPALEGRKTHSS